MTPARAAAHLADALALHALTCRRVRLTRERIYALLSDLNDLQTLERDLSGTAGDPEAGEEPRAGILDIFIWRFHAAKEQERAELEREMELEGLDEGMRAWLRFEALPAEEQARQWAACTPQANAG